MFKNLQVFLITSAWTTDLQAAEAALDAARFVECGASQEKSIGWIEPRGEKNGPLIESIGGQWILKMMVESKMLPGSVVKKKVDLRVEEIEAQTGRKPGKLRGVRHPAWGGLQIWLLQGHGGSRRRVF